MRKLPTKKNNFGIFLLKAGIVAEFSAFIGCFYVYYRMNTNQEFRYYMHKNFNSGLEAYYKVGDFFDSTNTTRQQDLTAFAALEASSTSEPQN